MNYLEFELEMKGLVKEYTVDGRQPPYGEKRIEAIFQAFKGISVKEFKEILDRAFTSERQAPLAKDLLRIAEEVRVAKHNQTKKFNIPADNFQPADPTVVQETMGNVFNILKGRGEGA